MLLLLACLFPETVGTAIILSTEMTPRPTLPVRWTSCTARVSTCTASCSTWAAMLGLCLKAGLGEKCCSSIESRVCLVLSVVFVARDHALIACETRKAKHHWPSRKVPDSFVGIRGDEPPALIALAWCVLFAWDIRSTVERRRGRLYEVDVATAMLGA